MARGTTLRLLLLALLLAGIGAILPNRFYFDVAILVCLNAVVAVGLSLLIGQAGQISLGHAAFYGLGAYGMAVLTTQFGWPPLAALAVSVVVTTLLAFVVARPILRLSGHYLAMATLGFGLVVSIVIAQQDTLTGGPDGTSVAPFTVFGRLVDGDRTWYAIVGVVLLLTVWMAQNLIASPRGRALRALDASEVAARVSGVDVRSYKTFVFVLSAGLASLAGCLFAAYSGFVTPVEAAFGRSTEFVAMVVLGGMTSPFGAVIGATLLTLLPQVLTVFQDYDQLVLGAILTGVMMFLPEGIGPSVMRKVAFRKAG